MCDGILHVNRFHHLNFLILHVYFVQNLCTMNILEERDDNPLTIKIPSKMVIELSIQSFF